ncbi:Hpt domain-containing protein [Alkalicaulis satelles]|uniref:Hpt domain-containing protein n=1 Tax=Alkalicaulis satelles TaxID=2609175 RepID=UPI001E4F2659|nr:Hpt domain-containing protein [Alkalicaulis satelles]
MTHPDQALPVLDRAHLRRYSGGDAALEAELFALLESQMGACLAAMKAADDDEAWRRAAHTLKGASRGVGAMALGEACARAEDQPRDGQALAQVEKAAGAVSREIAALRGG